MKNSKIAKILITLLSLSLIICGVFALQASAEGEAEKPVIVSKNISTEGLIHLCYAIPATNTITAENSTLSVYTSSDCSETSRLGTYTPYKNQVHTDINVPGYDAGTGFIIFKTGGISANNMAKYYYAQAESNGVKSKVVRYSVAEYLYERLYVSTYTEKETEYKTFYNAMLNYGIAAEKLYGKPETNSTLLSELNYVYVDKALGTLDGKNYSGLYASGTELKLNFTKDGDFDSCNVKTLDADGNFVTNRHTSSAITASGTTLVTGVTFFVDNIEKDNHGETFNAAFKDTNYENVELTDTANHKYSASIYANRGTSGDQAKVMFGIVNDPTDETNRVLRLSKGSNTKPYEYEKRYQTNLYINAPATTAFDKIIFESDLYLDYADDSPNHLYYFYMKNNSSETGVQFLLGKDGNNLSLRLTGNDVTTTYEPVSGIPFEQSWFNLRVEYYIVDASTNSTNTKIYINDTLVKDVTYTQTATALLDFSTIHIVSDGQTYGDFYMDNVTFKKVYAEDEAHSAYTFDGDTLPDGVSFSSWNNPTTGSSTVSNGQLLLSSESNYTDVLTFTTKETETLGGNFNTTIVSLDLNIKAVAAHADGDYTELQFRDTEGKTFRFLLMAGSNAGSNIWFRSYTYNSLAEVSSGSKAVTETTFNLRLEYYIDATTEKAKVDIYVNGIYCGTTYDDNEPVLAPENINRFCFACRSGDTLSVTFDNVRIYKINKDR